MEKREIIKIIGIIVTIIVVVGIYLFNNYKKNEVKSAPKAESEKSQSYLDNIYPYIITDGYFPTQEIKKETPIIAKMKGGLYLTLVKEVGVTLTNVKKSDLEKKGISIKEAFDSALKNLEIALSEQKIKINFYNNPGVGKLPFVRFSDHWLSAVSIFSPGLFDNIGGSFNSDKLYILIPNRDTMVIFSGGSEKETQNFKKEIMEIEKDSNKPLTFEMFEVTKEGIIGIEYEF